MHACSPGSLPECPGSWRQNATGQSWLGLSLHVGFWLRLWVTSARGGGGCWGSLAGSALELRGAPAQQFLLHPAPNQCDLNCLAEGHAFYHSFGRVLDGTPCSRGARELCVAGRCLVRIRRAPPPHVCPAPACHFRSLGPPPPALTPPLSGSHPILLPPRLASLLSVPPPCPISFGSITRPLP